eukprot:3811479-Prymnesium_polylepis.1
MCVGGGREHGAGGCAWVREDCQPCTKTTASCERAPWCAACACQPSSRRESAGGSPTVDASETSPVAWQPLACGRWAEWSGVRAVRARVRVGGRGWAPRRG